MKEESFLIYKGLKFSPNVPYKSSEADIMEFASKWDPYPFHTDREAAKESFFGELTAPGVMMDAVLIIMAHDLSPRFPDDAILGMIGAEDVKYLKPMKPNVVYTSSGIIASLKQSNSNPDQSVIKIQWEILSEEGVAIFNRTNVLLVKSKYCKFEV